MMVESLLSPINLPVSDVALQAALPSGAVRKGDGPRPLTENL